MSVSLVGAGPGDPSLMTLAASARVDAAEVVLTSGAGLLEAARSGRRVVRLYRGDPWMHPSFAAESAALTLAGIAFETVPGVAVELSTGTPVHVRHLARVATVVRDGVEVDRAAHTTYLDVDAAGVVTVTGPTT